MKEIEKKVCDLIAAVWLSGLDSSKKDMSCCNSYNNSRSGTAEGMQLSKES